MFSYLNFFTSLHAYVIDVLPVFSLSPFYEPLSV